MRYLEINKFLLFEILLLMNVIIFCHPIILILRLILLSLICSAALLLFSSKWFSFSLILIFLGGIIIIFLYFVSISNNIKIITLFSNKNTYLILLPLMFIIFINSELNYSHFISKSIFLLWFFEENFKFFFAYFVFALLIRLFLVVKNAECFKGSLVKW